MTCARVAFEYDKLVVVIPRSSKRAGTTGTAPRESRGVVSLATLSAHLGLSAAVISRVLNGAPAAACIPQKTQDRIFAAAREFNYRPNTLARSLRQGRSMMIGVLVPEVSEGYATLVLSGLEQALLKAGYLFILISHHHRADIIEHSLGVLSQRAVDGLVAIDTLFRYGGPLPIVTVSCPNISETAVNIVLDHDHAARLALEHLHALGHRRIAVIKGQAFSSDTATRWFAICEAAKTLGMVIDPELVVQLEGMEPTHEPGYLATCTLLRREVDFTALFAFNDVSAIGAMRALNESGLRTPQDVSVIGFDDIQSARYQTPSLTTVRQPLHAMGVLAGETVLAKIGGTKDAGSQNGSNGRDPLADMRTIDLKPELALRESTAPARTTPRDRS